MKRQAARFKTIAGIELVTIPVTHYAELLECQRRLMAGSLDNRQLITPSRGIIDRNPEVAVFLAQRFGVVPMATLLRLCKRTFGSARTPSQSAAYRYWQSLRKGASNRL